MATCKNKEEGGEREIVGCGTTGSGSSLICGVPRFVDLHLSRLDPHTTAEDVVNYLKSQFPEVIAEGLKTKHPSYASFKVSIHENSFRTAMEPSIWPANAVVNKFFHRRQRKQVESDSVLPTYNVS